MMTDITGMTHKIVKIFAISLALVFIVVFLTASMPQSTAQTSPQVIAQAVANPISTGQPVISENTNITWSSFNQTMAPNEYLNSTGHPEYINAEPSIYYQNYISINPADIIAPKELQNDTLGTGDNWANASDWGIVRDGQANTTCSVAAEDLHGQHAIVLTVTISGNQAGISPYAYIQVPLADYPSQSTQYDYLTMIGRISVPTDSGANGHWDVMNSTGSYISTKSTADQTIYTSMSLGQIAKEYGTGFNTSAGQGFSASMKALIQLSIPANAPDGTYSATLTGMALTTFPITFGSNYTGSVITQNTGNLQLSDFHPDNVNNVSIVNDGYTEALSMPTQMSENYTETQNQITGSNYIEEETLQGNLLYPTGTDITYTASNVSVQFNGISGSQIPLLNVNGVSYSTQIGNVSGNSTTLISTNPNQPVSVIYQVQYTASQWNSFTAPPFFLSVQGIEYYWWVGLIAIFGGLGIFAGLRSYATGKEEDLRAPPKVR